MPRPERSGCPPRTGFASPRVKDVVGERGDGQEYEAGEDEAGLGAVEGPTAEERASASGACSSVSELAPLCSPAAEMPWAILIRTRRIGARTPIESALGIHPMRKVAAPIRMSVSSMIFLRPTRSPKWPRTTAPRGGRATYATPKVASESRAACPLSGKNTVGKMSAAAEA